MPAPGIKRKPRGRPFEPGNKIGPRFQPGESGNPLGRPKGFGELVRESTGEGTELVDLALKVLRGQSLGKRTIPGMGEIELVPELRDRLEAMKWLADRGWGRATQEIRTEITESDRLKEMTDEQLLDAILDCAADHHVDLLARLAARGHEAD